MQESYNSYNIDQLAKDIRRSKKTIYKCFGSKSTLIKEIFINHQKQTQLKFEEIAHRNSSEIDKLLKFLYLTDTSLRKIRLSHWYQQASGYDEISELYLEFRSVVYERFLKENFLPYQKNYVYTKKVQLK